jgi:hypothetical protein
MVTAKKVALLGFVSLLLWEDKEGSTVVRDWPSLRARSKASRLALCSNARGTAIYLLPWAGNVKRAALPAGAGAEKKRFRLWSEFEEGEAFKITIRKDTLYHIGRPLRLEYISDKWTGKETRYFHNFKKRGCKLYTTRGEAESFGILHERGQQIVSARGIIG